MSFGALIVKIEIVFDKKGACERWKFDTLLNLVASLWICMLPNHFIHFSSQTSCGGAIQKCYPMIIDWCFWSSSADMLATSIQMNINLFTHNVLWCIHIHSNSIPGMLQQSGRHSVIQSASHENTWEYYLHCGWWEIMVVTCCNWQDLGHGQLRHLLHWPRQGGGHGRWWQMCTHPVAIHLRSLVPASVASATSLRSFPNGFLEISVLWSLQPDQDGMEWLMIFTTHSQSWETLRYKPVTSISMLHHAPSAGRGLHLHVHVLLPTHSTILPPTCVWDFLTNYNTNITSVAVFPWWSSGPPYSSAAWGQREPWVQLAALAAMWRSTPRSGGQIHESYAKTVQELKALAHQLWDQGDMLDEMKQRQDCSKQTSLWMESNIVICCNLYVM